jgi:FkbM family methyltransferase
MALNYRRGIRKIFQRFGIDIRKVGTSDAAMAPLPKLLLHHEIDLVLDVGANVGQYGWYLYKIGYKGRVVSFEPIPAAHGKLVEMAKGYDGWTVAPAGGIGDEDGQATLNVSENSVSSSILEHSGRTQLDSLPSARFEDTISVEMSRLDTVAPRYISESDQVFLKIDVQGYEPNVLAGATETIPRLKGIQLETSLVRLYEDEPLYPEMVELVSSYGFELQTLIPGYWDRTTGRLLQVDCVFFR